MLSIAREISPSAYDAQHATTCSRAQKRRRPSSGPALLHVNPKAHGGPEAVLQATQDPFQDGASHLGTSCPGAQGLRLLCDSCPREACIAVHEGVCHGRNVCDAETQLSCPRGRYMNIRRWLQLASDALLSRSVQSLGWPLKSRELRPLSSPSGCLGGCGHLAQAPPTYPRGHPELSYCLPAGDESFRNLLSWRWCDARPSPARQPQEGAARQTAVLEVSRRSNGMARGASRAGGGRNGSVEAGVTRQKCLFCSLV